MTRRTLRLFFVLWLALLGSQAHGTIFWKYSWQEGLDRDVAATTSADEGTLRWKSIEFRRSPTAEDLDVLTRSPGAERLTVIHREPVAAYLEPRYQSLAQRLTGRRVPVELRFVGSLPTSFEAQVLLPACQAGALIRFLSPALPSIEEIENLRVLESCVQIWFVLGRFPLYEEVPLLRRMAGLSFRFHTDYFPSYPHVDNLNLVRAPISLAIQATPTEAQQIALLNYLERLPSFAIQFYSPPMPEQYALLAELKRDQHRRLSLEWPSNVGAPRASDFEIWARLAPESITVPIESAETERVARAALSRLGNDAQVIFIDNPRGALNAWMSGPLFSP